MHRSSWLAIVIAFLPLTAFAQQGVGTQPRALAVEEVILPLLVAAEADALGGRHGSALFRADIVLSCLGLGSPLRGRVEQTRRQALIGLAGSTPEAQESEVVVEPLVAAARDLRTGDALSYLRADLALRWLDPTSTLGQEAVALRDAARERMTQFHSTARRLGEPFDGHPAEPPLPPRVRLFGEILTGLLTLGGGFAVGGLIGLAAAPSCGLIFCFLDEGLSRFATGGIIGVASMLSFVPLTLSAAASLHGGRGDVGSAYIGLVLGAAVGAGLGGAGYAVATSCSGSALDCLGHSFVGGFLAVLGGVVALVSPFIGYEVAHRSRPAPVELAPTISISAEGGRLGLAGSF